MIKFAWRNLILFMALLLVAGCSQQDNPIKIAVSYISGNPANSNYIKWLKSVDTIAEYVVMNKIHRDSVEIVFDDCSALLLTGGEDVFPGNYGQAEDTVNCGRINYYRDSLEFLLIDLALDHEMPVMGVCRGQQILNVALGGSLIVDIPSELNTRVYHRCYDWEKCFHDVRVFDDNLLSEISGINKGNVNSNHHQAVKMLAKKLKVLAISNDGLIESVGWKEPLDKSYLLAVQWHPERLDSTNMLSRPLAERFLTETRKYHSN